MHTLHSVVAFSPFLNRQQVLEHQCAAYQAQLIRAEGQQNVSKRVQRVLAYIHTHLFDEGLQAGQVLSACKIQSHTFRTQFRYQTGYTLKGYIRRHRLALACELLQDAALDISDIAYGLGYSHPNTFRAVFKRTLGQTPSSFRKQN